MLLNNQQIIEEIKKEIKICIEMNENESTTTQNLWDTIKAVLRGSSVQFSCSVVSDSVWPHRQQPTRLPRRWDSPGKNTGVDCHFLLQWMKVKSEKWKWSRSVLSDSATPWTAAYQAPPSMKFSRQEYWSGVPLPSPQKSTKLPQRNVSE